MTIRDIMKKCDAELVTGEELLDREIKAVCASDLLSDVLATEKQDFMLITGLCTPQVVRTAELMGSLGVMYVRHKYPLQEAIGMAKVHEVPLICTKDDLFETCCKLAGCGLEQK